MKSKWMVLVAALCGLALVGAGCGGDDEDDNQGLSYEETSQAINDICARYDTDAKENELDGTAANDAPVIADLNQQLQEGLDEVRAVDAAEELRPARDEFVAIGEEQLSEGRKLQVAAEEDEAAYQQALGELPRDLRERANLAASQLGAEECIDRDDEEADEGDGEVAPEG